MAPEMQRALELARKAAELGEIPVGAVISLNGEIIASAHNEVECKGQATYHAEILALKRANKVLRTKYLSDCMLWVTLEPCPMCAAAIAVSRVGTLIFGASDPKSGGVHFGPQIFDHPTCHHVPEIRSGLGAAESESLLKKFFADRR